MNRLKYLFSGSKLLAFGCVCCCFAVASLTSCDDMLDMGNDDVLYADKNHLTEANDTVNSFVGILAQLQKIAVRTNLFGELRADLVTVEPTADADLKAISNFEVSDDNAYNRPRDYYAVINNCNYFLANADTALRENKYLNGIAQNVRVFQSEYCAVRAIRAWLYLQLGQIYGQNIPVVTEPILSLEDADAILANSRTYDLAGICDYFIQDLKPFVAWFGYPYHGNPGYAGYNSSMPSRMAVMPIQLVLGDLYLWLASIRQEPLLAREAAKCYYDYIDWTPTDAGVDNNESYKRKTVLGVLKDEWEERFFTNGDYTRANSAEYSWFRTTSFGTESSEVISAIAMDSASSQGHFNELRYLYSWNVDNEDVDAVIVPSQPCYEYSDGQVYYARYAAPSGGYASTVVSAGSLSESLLQRHFLGDLRLPANISSSYRGDDRHEAKGIRKISSPQDFIVYRRGDIYLRLAEAMNYAGFPKFALAILTTGLDNNVIRDRHGEIYKEIVNADGSINTADSTFIWYFDFPTQYYKTRIQGFSNAGAMRVNLTDRDDQFTQIGLHARGSGYAINNPYYYPASTDVPADSTGYPGQPPVYVANDESQTVGSNIIAQLQERNPELIALAEADSLSGVVLPDIENTELYPTARDRRDAANAYAQALSEYAARLYTAWELATDAWYVQYGQPQVYQRQIQVVDSLLDVESALETAFEGFRFGALMRADYRFGGTGRKYGVSGRTFAQGEYLAEKVGRRDASLKARLMDRNNWFVKWNGQIGK